MTEREAPTLLCWQAERTPDILHAILRTLGEEYPIREAASAELNLRFITIEDPDYCVVERCANDAIIRYGSIPLALRGISSLLGGLNDGETREERCAITTVSMLLDCAQNGVITVQHFKRWLRRLALLGYNQALLYVENVFELPDEPIFGYQRGRYTLEELQDIDQYASQLGIEMVGIIQTLGHSGQYLRWPAYREIADSKYVLLVGEDKTYALIEKMILQMHKAFRSRRLHIGMDEAFGLGRGRYQDLHGVRSPYDIFIEHLTRVTALCRQYGFAPMMWSDMFFRLASANHDYYDSNAVIPEDVIKHAPTDVTLAYWDYDHEDTQSYLDMIRRHRDFGRDPIVVPNVWTWFKVWYDHALTVKTLGPCIEACHEAGIREIMITLWGNDGAYCDFDSALAGLTYAAEKIYRDAGDDDPLLARRFQAVCRADYFAHRRAGQFDGLMSSGYILWDDPFYALIVRNLMEKEQVDKPALVRKLREIAEDLLPHLDDHQAGDIRHAWLLARFIADKIMLTDDLYRSYTDGDHTALADIGQRTGELIVLLRDLTASFRKNWMRRNKPFGYEVIQIRLAGLCARYEELETRLGEYLAGTVATIPELDGNLTPPDSYLPGLSYRDTATVSDIF